MARRERVVDVVIPIVPGGGGFGGVGAMFALFGGVVLFAVLVMLIVVAAYPSPHYSTVPTRELGPCAPFCSARTTTVQAPAGGEQR
jgi:hypothetical protein